MPTLLRTFLSSDTAALAPTPTTRDAKGGVLLPAATSALAPAPQHCCLNIAAAIPRLLNSAKHNSNTATFNAAAPMPTTRYAKYGILPPAAPAAAPASVIPETDDEDDDEGAPETRDAGCDAGDSSSDDQDSSESEEEEEGSGGLDEVQANLAAALARSNTDRVILDDLLNRRMIKGPGGARVLPLLRTVKHLAVTHEGVR